MSSGESGPLRAIGIAALIVIVGGSLLKMASPASHSDPAASVDNGAPRGWLALGLLIEKRGAQRLHVVKAGEEDGRLAALGKGDIVFVGAPERASFSTGEAEELLVGAERGARIVVVCDPLKARARRLSALLGPIGVHCIDVDEAWAPTTATAPAGVPSPVFLRDRGRLGLNDESGFVPLLVAADGGRDELVAVARARGRGDIVVVGSGTFFANDGLGLEQSAAFFLWLVGDRTVIVDERHHSGRGRAVLGNAVLKGPGPVTAGICLSLLLVLSLLAFAPRRGDFDSDDDPDQRGGGSAARVRALAALMQADRSGGASRFEPKATEGRKP